MNPDPAQGSRRGPRVAHAACFAGLLLRRGWSRLLGATLAFGWAALLGVQVAEQLSLGTLADGTGMLVALGLMVLLLLFGSCLLSSGRARSFLGQ